MNPRERFLQSVLFGRPTLLVARLEVQPVPSRPNASAAATLRVACSNPILPGPLKRLASAMPQAGPD